jgi:hypothetical protein
MSGGTAETVVWTPVPLEVNNDTVLADAALSVRALATAKETVVSPPKSNDPARAVRRPRRMRVFIGLPRPQVPATRLPQVSSSSHGSGQLVFQT